MNRILPTVYMCNKLHYYVTAFFFCIYVVRWRRDTKERNGLPVSSFLNKEESLRLRKVS